MFKLECHQNELDQCSIDMKRLIARNNFNNKTSNYEGFSEQYVQEVFEQFPSHQDKKPMEETRQPQDHLGITGPGALAITGQQVLPFQSHKTFHLSQDTRLQDALEAIGIFSSHEQVQEQMTFPKEAKGNSQDSGYSTALEAMVKFGQMIPPYQALAIILFTQDARNQDAPEAMVKISSREQVQEHMTCPKEAKVNSQDSGYITGPEDTVKFGQTRPPSQALSISLFTQDARNQDVPEAIGNVISSEKNQEQMPFPKEAKGNSQNLGYITTPEAMVKFGQTIPPSQALTINLSPQDAKTQDAPEAMVNYLLMNRCKNRKPS
jgi:hypothetical protein